MPQIPARSVTEDSEAQAMETATDLRAEFLTEQDYTKLSAPFRKVSWSLIDLFFADALAAPGETLAHASG